jgi:WhiB family redox-sensing transcriptional regulator
VVPERGDTFSGQVALTICRTCPVRVECLAEAVALGDVEGIRGGLTADERRALSDS